MSFKSRKELYESYNFDPFEKLKSENEELYKNYYFSKSIFLFFLINNSIIYSKKHVEDLIIKVNFHSDWKELFKVEISKYMEKAIRFGNKKGYDLQLFSTNALNDKIEIKINSFQNELISFKNINKDAMNLNSFIGFVNFNTQMEDVTITNIQNGFSFNLLEPMKKFNDTIEEIFKDRLKHFEDYKILLEKLGKETNFEFDDNFLYADYKTINEKITGFKSLVKYYSYFYYIFLLKTLLKNKNFSIKDIEVYRGLYNLPMLDKYSDIEKSTTLTYNWSIKKNSDITRIYSNLKHKLNGTSLNDFKAIFSNKKIDEIKPININFSASELLYFILQLMDLEYITKDSNFSYVRLKACFKKKDGEEFNENLKGLKNGLKKDEDEGDFKNLSLTKRTEINRIINDKK